jgi:hypothetical protein
MLYPVFYSSFKACKKCSFENINTFKEMLNKIFGKLIET